MSYKEINLITVKIIGGLHYLLDKFYGYKNNPFFIETTFTKITDLFLKNFSTILDNICFLPPEFNTKDSRIKFCTSDISQQTYMYQKKLQQFLKLSYNYDYIIEYLKFIYSNILRVYSSSKIKNDLEIYPIYENYNYHENYPIYEEIEY
jgi:hypothetical protein